MMCLMKGDNGRAVEAFEKAIASTDHPAPQAYYRLGEIYSNQGKTAEAIEAFTKAAQVGKGTAMQQLAESRIAELKKK